MRSISTISRRVHSGSAVERIDDIAVIDLHLRSAGCRVCGRPLFVMAEPQGPERGPSSKLKILRPISPADCYQGEGLQVVPAANHGGDSDKGSNGILGRVNEKTTGC